MKLATETTINLNGIEVTLKKGTEIQFPSDDRDAVLAFASITKLPLDLSFTENGIKYVEGAGGKFVAVPDEPVQPKAQKAKAKKTEKSDKK